MKKMILKESELKLLIKKVITETNDSSFQLTSPESKLEFLVSSIKNLIGEFDSENNGDMIYYGNRLKRIINMVEGVNEEKYAKLNGHVIDESIIKMVVENVLNEWRPRNGYDEWANIETGGAHGKGVQNRRNFTRKENQKGEKSTKLQTPSDIIQLILKVDPYDDEMTGKIFNLIVKKYKNNSFKLSDVHLITELPQIKNIPIGQMLSEFVDAENEITHFYPTNFRDKETSKPQQPK